MRMYNAISLSSGAARGLYQLGALHAAECNGLLKNVKYFAGTSVGSIIALLLAIGYTPMSLFTHICIEDISKCLQQQSLDIKTLMNHWGAVDISVFREYLAKMIIHKWGGIPTFAELAKDNIYFLCPAYRLKHSQPRVYFNYKTHPNMSVLDAALLSSTIPFLFRSANWEGDFYIDGGVFDLNPVNTLHTFISSSETPNILCVNLDLRRSDEDTVITSLMEYVKEIAFVSMYAQPDIEQSEHIDCIKLVTDVNSQISIQVDNKLKIKWFCAGLEQGLNFFKGKFD
jgi:NTE family protein